MGKKATKNIFCLFFLVTLFLVNACARHQIIFKKSPPPKEQRAKTKGVYHVVERHQTLYRISKTYGVDMKRVASINGITDHSKIETGQRIFIPGAKKDGSSWKGPQIYLTRKSGCQSFLTEFLSILVS